MIALACLLVGAAPADVPVGAFQAWAAYKKLPLDFTSGGVSVHVEALPCSDRPATQSESCHFERFNNQAIVTVGAPGRAPMTVPTDRQSSYARGTAVST